MKIGIDVDLTIVDTDKYWRKWLDNNFTLKIQIPDRNIDYNLGFYYGSTVRDYFGRTDLYDDIKIDPRITKLVADWQKQGHDITFISYCFDEHLRSKQELLYRSFKDFGFVNTYDKYKVSVDVMIDDRNNNLNRFRSSTILFRPYTPFTQNEPMKDGIIPIKNILELRKIKDLYDYQKIM